MSQNIVLRKCGVRFEPPAIFVTYALKETGKLHRRTMPLRNFNKHSGVLRVSEELKQNARHKKYLEELPLVQLEKLVTVIHDKLNGLTLGESVKRNQALNRIDPEEDLNKVDEVTLRRKKAIMENSFEKNRKKMGDSDFTYDKETDFEGAIESCEWDSDTDDEF